MKPDRRNAPVRCFITISSLAMLVFLAACRSDKPAEVYPSEDWLTVTRNAHIPLPLTTPFDNTPQLRTEYLEAYQDGYRSGLTGMYLTFRKPLAGDTTARIKGWQDGGEAGLKEYFFRNNRR
jgi:hypothetical protein